MTLHVVGIGLGDISLLTHEGREVLEGADLVVGAARQVAAMHFLKNQKQVYQTLADLQTILDAYKNQKIEISVLASGDPMYYGIAEWLKQTYPNTPCRFVSGISSAQYLFAKIAMQMHDVFLTSVHGREPKWSFLTSCSKVCMVTDKKWNPYAIAKWHLENGINPWMVIGESLSYPEERISLCRAEDVENRAYAINLVVIDYER